MAKIKLEVDVEPAQIDALRVYLGRKDTQLEFELARYIELLYGKHVPAIVRDYIAANNENKKKEGRTEAV